MADLKVEQILRAHIRKIIKEDGEGGGFGGDFGLSTGIGGAWGMGYGIGKDLGKFLDPFIDVAKTAVGKTKELSVKAQTLARVSIEALLVTLVPFCSDDYGKIFEKEKQDMERLKNEYGEVYQRTWDAFKNEDFLCSAFFYSPQSLLTTVAITQAPAATVKLLSILSGGRLDSLLDRILAKYPSGPKMPNVAAMSKERDFSQVKD
jgi:hypothetical protein